MKPTNHIDNFKKEINFVEYFSKVKETGNPVGFRDLTESQTVELCNELESAGVDVRTSEWDKKRMAEKAKEMAGLFIPGLSEFLPLYDVSIYRNYGNICAKVSIYAYLLIDNRVYRTYDRNGKFTLFYYNGTNPRGFEYKEEAPNRIGKATVKKLAQWVEYLDRKEAAAVEYLNKGAAELNALIERLDASGVQYQRGNNTIVIKNGPFSLKYEITPGGLCCGRPEFDFYDIYRRKQFADTTALDFMLNNNFSNL